MKIFQCKRGQIYDIGFVDPNFVHEKSLLDFYDETENNLVNALRFNEIKRTNTISLQLQVSVTVFYTFYFA